MIVDAHCHAGPGDGLTGPWDTDAPLGAYLRRARAAGIARTVIFAPFHSDYRRANATTARIVARDPERLIGFAFAMVAPRASCARRPQSSAKLPRCGTMKRTSGYCGASVIDQIARLPNVYADTSGVRRFDYLAEAVRRAGPGKLIFGSDGPWLHPGLELEKIRLLRLPPPDEVLITGGTILRLLAGTPAAKTAVR